MASHAGDPRVLYEVDWIRPTRVFRDARVGEVHGVVFIEHDILQYGAEAERAEYVRLALGREIDCFCITATFDIEDAVVAPNVLVVADQVPFRIRRKRSLASARQPKQQR